MDTIIKADGLVKKYSAGHDVVYALNKVNIEVVEGKLVIFRGRSGSGKTTLLNQICLLDRPDEGYVNFDNTDAVNASDKWRDNCRRRNFGIIFQSVALLPQMNALENVDFGMRVAGMKSAARIERAHECLSLVGMSKRATHMPIELSGGEQQRVAIARAIAHHPRILFADEPTSELDSHTALQIMKVFLELIEKENITVVMTTHDPTLMGLGYRVYTLEDGEIVDG